MEIGPQDISKNQTVAVRRDTGKKDTASLDDLSVAVPVLLDQIQRSMFETARDLYHSRVKEVSSWDDVVPALDRKCVVAIPWCEIEKCEDDIKERSGRA